VVEESSLAGRVALVTGASGGIGAALAEALAGAGARLGLAYGRGVRPAERLRDAIRARGGEAVAIGCDLREAAAAAELVAAAERELGPVDVLVANAGVGRRLALDQVDTEAWDEALAVNLRAPFLLAQRTLPGMCERGFGRVLFVSSVAAFTGGLVGPQYAASKAGLHGLAHFLAARAAPHGVTVNVIAPALVAETGMLPGEPDELRRAVPVGRLGRPEEVARLALAVLENGYLTSQVVALDGGMHPR
jgi:3-oxoacyl-[acyl-carrier protein] reductase